MTGRYPWGVGYYDMTGQELVSLDTTMLPALLKTEGYSTHAIGKWNLGMLTKQYTPTYRGFDTFFGYYAAALKDYWYHFGGVNGRPCSANLVNGVTDLSNSTLNEVRHADNVLNGTYDTDLFAAEAVRLITARDPKVPLYIYLAFQAVHCAAQDQATVSGQQPLHAPCTTVDGVYSTTIEDTHKVQGAMLTELDYGFGNVTSALDADTRPYLLLLVADNGGPLGQSTNAPLRGGKHTLWDGGVRVIGFVTGPLIPPDRRGTTWDGLAHASDWYATLVIGVAGSSLDLNATGPRPPDSHNLWPALLNAGESPRVEVIHQVVNNHSIGQGIAFPGTIRLGKYKLFWNYPGASEPPGDDRIVPWPERGTAVVPFGGTNGTRNAYAGETNHCRAGFVKSGGSPTMTCVPGCLFNLEVVGCMGAWSCPPRFSLSLSPARTTFVQRDQKFHMRLNHHRPRSRATPPPPP